MLFIRIHNSRGFPCLLRYGAEGVLFWRFVFNGVSTATLVHLLAAIPSCDNELSCSRDLPVAGNDVIWRIYHSAPRLRGFDRTIDQCVRRRFTRRSLYVFYYFFINGRKFKTEFYVTNFSFPPPAPLFDSYKNSICVCACRFRKRFNDFLYDYPVTVCQNHIAKHDWLSYLLFFGDIYISIKPVINIEHCSSIDESDLWSVGWISN